MVEYLKYAYDSKVLIVLVLLYLLYKFVKLNQSIHLRIGHEGPPPLPFIGNLHVLKEMGFYKFDNVHFKKYGKLFPYYLGSTGFIMVADEEMLKQIFVKESRCFPNRMDVGIRGKSNRGILNSLKGEEWRKMRNLITPTLTSEKLRKFAPLINDGVQVLEKRFKEHPAEQPIDFKDFFGGLSMDVISRTMFGMQVDSQSGPDNIFLVHTKKIALTSFFSYLNMVTVILPILNKFIRTFISKSEVFTKDSLDFLNRSFGAAIKTHKEYPEQYSDFLAMMLKFNKEVDETDPERLKIPDSKALKIEEIKAQSFIFMLAGFETISTTLTYLSFFLAKNPSAQQELYEEILNNIGIEGKITYESLAKLPLLDASIFETMRLCPPIIRTDRQCTQNITLLTSDNQKVTIKKGDNIIVPISAIHRDPDRWPNPEVFDLHRFDLENKKNQRPYSYMPFGLGPRICLGMRFSFLEIKWAMVTMLREFEIITCPETIEKIEFRKSGFALPVNPVILKVQKRG